jgi:hypothetical protein
MSGASYKPDASSGSSMSEIGGRGVYQADDRRTVPDSKKNKAERYEDGRENSHKHNDSNRHTSTDPTECSRSGGVAD